MSNSEAEVGIIGEMCFKPSKNCPIAQALIKPEYFASEGLREIYEHIQSDWSDVDNCGESISIIETLRLNDIGTHEEQMACLQGAGVPIKHYCKKLREEALERRLIAECRAGMHGAANRDRSAAELIQELSVRLEQLRQDAEPSQGLITVGDDMAEYRQVLEDDCQRGFMLNGVPTGLRDLDKRIGGLRKGELVILAACTSVGKTTLALNIAEHAALDNDIGVAIFSFEMGRSQLIDRIVASRSGVNRADLVAGGSHEMHSRVTQAMGDVARAPLHIGDSSGRKITDVEAAVKELRLLGKSVDLVIIDYLQLMTGVGATREQEVASLSGGCKRLAVALDVPFLVLSQLNREASKRDSKDPNLSDLRDSGSIEQDADKVLFISRKKEEEEEPARVIVAKNRNGAMGVVDVFFCGPLTRFRDTEWRKY